MSDQPIKDGVYGFVSGTVGRSFETKNGRAFELEVKDQKQQYPDKWTIWGDLNVREGDRATVKGWLGISRETYQKDGETKVAIRRAVNKPELAASEHTPSASPRGAQGQPQQEEPWAQSAPGGTAATDAWNTPGSYSDETPF
jgi:hypothetical protein